MSGLNGLTRTPDTLLEEHLEILRSSRDGSPSLLQRNTARPWLRATSSMPLATSVKYGLVTARPR